MPNSKVLILAKTSCISWTYSHSPWNRNRSMQYRRMLNWSRPTNVGEIYSFFGFNMILQERFIEDFSMISGPLLS